MPDRRARQPRIALPVVLLAVAMIGVGVYGAVRAVVGDAAEDEEGGTTTTAPAPELRREGSKEVATPAGPPAFRTIAVSYEIRYRIRRPAERDAVETLTVVRPFTSRKVTTIDGRVVSEEEASLGRIAVRSSSSDPAQVIAGPPIPGDDRLDAVARDEAAIAAGIVEARETRDVGGRTCGVVRTGNGPDVLGRPTASDHTDTCLDPAGLVLERWRVEGGRAVEHRVATDVDVIADPDPDVVARATQLPVEPTLDANTGGGFFRQAEPTSEPPGEFLVLDDPPSGYTMRGRFSVIAAQEALLDPEQRDSIVASTADVFVRGADVIVLDRGATRGTVKPFEPHPDGRPVDLGPLFGPGEALATARGNEVRVTIPGGRFVRLYGTVPTAELVALALELRRTPGGTGLVLSGGG